jgi:cytochrome c peroxidase
VEGISLGRRLFFDANLSKNGEVSCASCHAQNLAFSDGMKLSNLGVSGKPLERHTPVLQNLAWHQGFFWDGGASDLESQVLGPLKHHDEMAMEIDDLLRYLKKTTPYPALFQKAFNDTIRVAYVQRALAQFEKTLISDQSKYDEFLLGTAELSPDERRGFSVFESNCQTCHVPPYFSDHNYHNNGLDTNLASDDIEDPILGRYRITQDSSDLNKYKTPSLRNIMVSAPYMHDGRFDNMEEVLEFYSENIQSSNSLDSTLTRGGLHLTTQDQKHIITFLETLTDTNFLKANKFKKP